MTDSTVYEILGDDELDELHVTSSKRGRPPKSDPSPNANTTKSKTGLNKLRDSLTYELTMVANLWAMGDPVCGGVAVEQAPKLAESLISWAKSSPKVAERLTRTVAGAGVIGVILAAAPLLATIVMHHRPRREPQEAPAMGGDDSGFANPVEPFVGFDVDTPDTFGSPAWINGQNT